MHLWPAPPASPLAPLGRRKTDAAPADERPSGRDCDMARLCEWLRAAETVVPATPACSDAAALTWRVGTRDDHPTIFTPIFVEAGIPRHI